MKRRSFLTALLGLPMAGLAAPVAQAMPGVIDGSLIVSGTISSEKITAGTIVCDKIAADAGRTVITDKYCEVYDSNNVLRVRIRAGLWGDDKPPRMIHSS